MTQHKACYHVDRRDGYCVVQFSAAPDTLGLKSFESHLGELGTQFVFIDCSSLAMIPKDWLRCFLQLHQSTKGAKKFLKLISVGPVLSAYLKVEGLDTTFRVCTDLREALIEMGPNPKKVFDTEFINPFLGATVRVLEVQAQIKSTPGEIFLKKERDTMLGDISGIIGIISEKFVGSVVISFPEKTFLKIISNMLGEEYQEISKDIIDGAGELTNMIFGQAKVTLNQKGYGIQTAIPSVISGKNHSLSTLSKGPIVVIPFSTDEGPFFVEVCVSTQGAA
jgi:chemotaxis protein CheX